MTTEGNKHPNSTARGQIYRLPLMASKTRTQSWNWKRWQHNRLCSGTNVTLTLAFDLDTLAHMATVQLAPSMLQFLCKQSTLQAQREPPSIVSVKAGPLLASQIRRERVQKPQAPFLTLDTKTFESRHHCIQPAQWYSLCSEPLKGKRTMIGEWIRHSSL